MNLEKAKEYFKNDVFAMKTTGIEIIETDENYAKCELTIDERHINAAGRVMGGVYFTLADFVFAVATNDPPEKHTVTTVSQISYLGACKGKKLIGESKLLKSGRRFIFMEINITDELGNSVAVINTTGAYV